MIQRPISIDRLRFNSQIISGTEEMKEPFDECMVEASKLHAQLVISSGSVARNRDPTGKLEIPAHLRTQVSKQTGVAVGYRNYARRTFLCIRIIEHLSVTSIVPSSVRRTRHQWRLCDVWAYSSSLPSGQVGASG